MRLFDADPETTPVGLKYAAPAMMALANLLSHPKLGTETMSEPIGDRKILRSAKDLGRVLALARLHEGDIEDWGPSWDAALRRCFPDEREVLASTIGDGLEALLADDAALEQAWHTTSVGLLRGLSATPEQLRALGRQLLHLVIDPLKP